MPPRLRQAQPSALAATLHDFGTAETQWSLDIWNSGAAGTTLTFSASVNNAVFSLDVSQGTSTGTGDHKTVVVSVDRAALAPGTTTAKLTVTRRLPQPPGDVARHAGGEQTRSSWASTTSACTA